MTAQHNHCQTCSPVASWRDHSNASNHLQQQLTLTFSELSKVAVPIDVSVNVLFQRFRPDTLSIMGPEICSIDVFPMPV